MPSTPSSREHLTATAIARILADQHGLGEALLLFRTLRHFTNQGLIDTVGAVNTGSGRSRLYAPAELVHAAILLRLHRLGVTVGFMRETMRALKRNLKDDYGTADIAVAAKDMVRPAIFVFVPDAAHPTPSVRLRPLDDAPQLRQERDVVVIQIGRFLQGLTR